MKVKGVRLHGAHDIRLEEFELPEIKEDEILVKVVSDSICMSTWKMVQAGKNHKRVPENVAEHPVIIGHEFTGDIVKVGEKWKDKFHEGKKFAQQPAIPGQMESPGYSYEFFGGASTYCIFPNDVIEKGCIWEYDGDSYFEASLGEPMSCCIGGYHSNYHTEHLSYEHKMGTLAGGDILILGGCGPMGLGAVSYGLTFENKPKRIVVTDINDAKIARAKEVISEAEAKEKGVELHYVNTANMEDPVAELRAITEGVGYSDVFVYAPVQSIAEMGNRLLAVDGCLNFFAGPTDTQFSASMNLYDCHYARTKIMGSTGGNTEDMKEAIEKSAKGLINSAVMVTHVGGIDSIVDTTNHLPNIPGGKKLAYIQFDMPMTAIEDFGKLGEKDPFFKKLDECCKRNKGLWSKEAEDMLFEHFGGVQS
ncbi:MAG: zinc-binding dehydrogenase [Lachnospiraceae bacterium]